MLALQAKRYPDIDMPYAIMQIKGRRIASEKFPEWYRNENIVYPAGISLEQSSSEKTAVYKSMLCEGESFADLTGGMGVDFSFMSRKFIRSFYVETQPELVSIAGNNFKALGLKGFEIINDTATAFLERTPPLDTIYIDPSRRSYLGKKTVLIEDCSPNLMEIDSLLSEKARKVIIKLSPMLDISSALKKINNISQVHILSYNNECKELVFIKQDSSWKSPEFYCINILKDSTDTFSFNQTTANTGIEYSAIPGKYLYEPNASILKAGYYGLLSTNFGLKKLHPNSHLFTSDVRHINFHGRGFIINEILPYSKNRIRSIYKNISHANITVRNFPDTVDIIRKKTKIKDGGDIYIFATTLTDEKKVLIICEKI